MFDPSRPPPTPIPAATVILVREVPGGVDVLLVRRHRASGFMGNAFVFPGGKVDPADGSAELAAVRELFEEAGVLLVREPVADDHRRALRDRLGAGGAFAALLEAEGLTPDVARLHWWARWITPSVEPKRFDAQFFVAELPGDQTPSIDEHEAVELRWVAPADAVAAHEAGGELRLPPPQLRTLAELAGSAPGGLAALTAEAARRRAHAHPFMPRFATAGDAAMLLLPWDPAYGDALGEACPMPDGHPLATGPSRFVLEGMSWRLTHAPGA